jgi:propionyl-CoA carboxylase alpha chain
MFKRILIANRGEIACRIIKTARRTGIETVAVYSEADRDALHVEMADEAVLIGPPAAAQSYLLIDKIVEACRATGAEAVHPGYGFLSEREAFPVALAKGRAWFHRARTQEPSPHGRQDRVEEAAAKAKVSTVPVISGVIADDKEAVQIANEDRLSGDDQGSAGRAGGKGMRIAIRKPRWRKGFARAKSEAKSSFATTACSSRSSVVNPRHVRDPGAGRQARQRHPPRRRECSIQRRNQKVIVEERRRRCSDEGHAKKDGRAGGRARQGGRLRQRLAPSSSSLARTRVSTSSR